MNQLQTTKNYWKIMMMSLGIFIFMLAIFFGLAILWAKYTSLNEGASSQEILYISKHQTLESADQFKIMTWNISYAFGVGSEGTETYRQLTNSEYQERFSKLVDVIKNENADVLLLQEIDFDSKRTHHHDQAREIALAAGYPYVAYAVSWDLNYVPFPDGFNRHFGKVRSGGAILSKFKIESNNVWLYDKPAENSFWYNWFYLFRYAQVVTLKINNQEHDVINAHLEAFNKQNRLDQIKLMAKLADQNNRLLFMGGDYNTTPTLAERKSNFEGYPEDDYDQDGAYEELRRVSNMRDSVADKEYTAQEAAWFTFPSTSPERKLDYIFVSDMLNVESKRVLSGTASDHLPLIIKVQFNQP